MHPFRFHSSLCPRCCYYQSWHHSFDMMGPVFPFICNGQEILNHFIFQAQQHLFFKKWLSSLSTSRFLPGLISCALHLSPPCLYFIFPFPFCFSGFFLFWFVLFFGVCFLFSPLLPMCSLLSFSPLIFLSMQGIEPVLQQPTEGFCWQYQPWVRTSSCLPVQRHFRIQYSWKLRRSGIFCFALKPSRPKGERKKEDESSLKLDVRLRGTRLKARS